MPDGVVETVETHFTAVDKSTAAINKIAGSAAKLDGILNRIGSGVMAAGGIAAIFGIHHAVEQIEDTYKAVSRVKAITGQSAEEAHAMLEAFELGGISLEKADRIILGMTRKTLEMGDGMGEGTKHAQDMSAEYRRLGISMKAGPQETLEKMADAAKAGKLKIDDTMKLFGVGRREAEDYQKFLMRGSAVIKKDTEEARRSAGVITDAQLRAFGEVKRAGREAHVAFMNIARTIYASVMPALAPMLTAVSHALENWAPMAQKFGKILTDHMAVFIAGAKTFVKIMAINKGLSLVGLGGIGKIAGRLAAPVASAFSSGGLTGALGAIGPLIGRFALFAPVAFLVYKALDVVIKHFNTFRPALAKLGDTLLGVWRDISSSLGPIVESIKGPLGEFFDMFVQGILLAAIEAVTDAIQKIIAIGTAIGDFMSSPVDKIKVAMAYKAAGVTSTETADLAHFSRRTRDMERWAAIHKAVLDAGKKAMSAAAAKGGMQVNQDFRGSRFDIKQDFAGVDPDRVAVAFANDLSALGERQIASGFEPAFSVR